MKATTNFSKAFFIIFLLFATTGFYNPDSDGFYNPDPEAQFLEGEKYYRGYGVPEDDKEAVKWYLLAAEQGHAKAQNNLGLMYDSDYF